MPKKEAITDFDKEDMYLICKKTLSKKYTPRDEWVIEELEQKEDEFVPDFMISRRVPSPLYWKKSEVVYVAIFVEDLEKRHIDVYNDYIENHRNEDVTLKGKIIITPSGADTSSVKDSDFELVRLNVFRIEKPRSTKTKSSLADE
ncbi:MAG: hypothetical protein PHR53_03565 [Bacteroidales bacterium]|nr:hypothetical protein [Bacteroidales bacterium]